LQALAQGRDVLKASRRDLAVAVARGRTAATTVAATMYLAHKAGVRIFATGGIGGAHRGPAPWDISADLLELARTPVAVVCAGAKSILDIPRTLEILETHGVLVAGYGTDEFPAFYLRSSGEPVTARVDTPEEAARLLAAHWALEGEGVVLAQPVEADTALEPGVLERALGEAEGQATAAGVRGPAVTPFLLARLAELTEGKTLKANQALVVANARLAARVACALTGGEAKLPGENEAPGRKSWTAAELRRLPQEQRDAILGAAASEAEEDYRSDPDAK
ncbi:MAG TPA: pseudouridine-5'-phosphate glycosidase, partial [Gemmataceae bacterium]|nr:pseudouridine-5'-phosphate glycosidase [Gemmataceae bacterium]